MTELSDDPIVSNIINVFLSNEKMLMAFKSMPTRDQREFLNRMETAVDSECRKCAMRVNGGKVATFAVDKDTNDVIMTENNLSWAELALISKLLDKEIGRQASLKVKKSED